MESTHNNAQWYCNWFDSDYYHILYKNRDESEARHFIDNLLNLLKPPMNSSILDVGCGRGRHAVYLNQKEYNVTGIDLSEQSIEYAKQFENEKLSFYIHDMRRTFRVNYFDLALNLFTSFGYFEKEEDNAKALKAIYKSLKPGGIFVLDYFNSNKLKGNLRSEETKKVDGIEFDIKRYHEDHFVIKKISFLDKQKKSQQHMECVRNFTKEEFENLFISSGFNIQYFLGDYSLNIFDPENSERLIVIARKP